MLRRKPTTITLTSEDIAAYENIRAAKRNGQENVKLTGAEGSSGTRAKGDSKVDPNDELKPLPVDRPRVRGGVGSASGGLGREERIVGR